MRLGSAFADRASAASLLLLDHLGQIKKQVKVDERSIDWTVRENVRAQLRVMVKRILRKYGYPPDLQEKATATVLEQAEVLSREWIAA